MSRLSLIKFIHISPLEKFYKSIHKKSITHCKVSSALINAMRRWLIRFRNVTFDAVWDRKHWIRRNFSHLKVSHPWWTPETHEEAFHSMVMPINSRQMWQFYIYIFQFGYQQTLKKRSTQFKLVLKILLYFTLIFLGFSYE